MARPMESAAAVATLERHPSDGWVRADPWPMNVALLRALDHLVAALCPPAEDGAPTDAALLAEVSLHVRRSLPYMHPLTARGSLLIVRLLDWSPLWRLRGVRRLSRLPVATASAHLNQLADGVLLGKLVFAMRAMVLTAYFDQPVVHTAIGYEPIGFMRQRIAARAQLLAGADDVPTISPTEATLTAARLAAHADPS